MKFVNDERVKILIMNDKQKDECKMLNVPRPLHNKEGIFIYYDNGRHVKTATIRIEDLYWHIPISCLCKVSIFCNYETEYEIIGRSFEFDEDNCLEHDLQYIDTNRVKGKLADIIAFARSKLYDNAADFASAILWNDSFILHYIFGDYSIVEVINGD